jgi:hypothetical protein
MSEQDHRPSPELPQDPEQRKMVKQFEHDIENAAPYLFNLADQLLEAYPRHQWNMLIGDDTGGRLPTRFVRKAFEAQGIEIPTHYIMANHDGRDAVEPAVYQEYVRKVLSEVEDPRVLIVSEDAGAFRTLGYLKELFSSEGAQVDLAVGAIPRPAPETLEPFFAGGIGHTPNAAMWAAFEKIDVGHQPLAKRVLRRAVPGVVKRAIANKIPEQMPHATTYPATNLDNIPHDNLPTATLHEDETYRSFAHYCYERMDQLADEYTKLREAQT